MSHTDTSYTKIMFFHQQEYMSEVSLHMYLENNCWYPDELYLDTVRQAKGHNNAPIDIVNWLKIIINNHFYSSVSLNSFSLVT